MRRHTYSKRSISLSLLFAGILALLGSCSTDKATFTVTDTYSTLEYAMNGKPLFTYNYGMVYPPQGVDTVYKRSGFIHPLCSLEGDTLTNCSPSDHYPRRCYICYRKE